MRLPSLAGFAVFRLVYCAVVCFSLQFTPTFCDGANWDPIPTSRAAQRRCGVAVMAAAWHLTAILFTSSFPGSRKYMRLAAVQCCGGACLAIAEFWNFTPPERNSVLVHSLRPNDKQDPCKNKRRGCRYRLRLPAYLPRPAGNRARCRFVPDTPVPVIFCPVLPPDFVFLLLRLTWLDSLEEFLYSLTL